MGILNARKVIKECEDKFFKIFNRKYSGLIETYKTEDADFVIVTLGTISGLVKEVVDDLRDKGQKVGLLRIRYLRPFPNEEIVEALKNVKAIGVLEKIFPLVMKALCIPMLIQLYTKQNLMWFHQII